MANALPEDFQPKPGAKLRVGVAIDGSQLSEKALKAACQVVNADRKDTLTILHVAPCGATSKHLNPTHLKNQFSGLAWDMMGKTNKVATEFASVEKRPDQSTCEALTMLAASSHTDLLVVGSYGRKGEKIDMLGSVSDYSLREAHASVYIVRSTMPLGEQQVFVFGTDGSRAAAQAFSKVIHLFARPGKDHVVLAKAGAQPPDKEFFAPYQAAMARHKVEGECLHWPVGPSQTVAQALLELARDKQATCICMGVTGYGSQKLGSVSEEISVHATCNTLVLKDPQEVAREQVAKAGARSIQAMVAPGKDKPARDKTGTLGQLSRPLGRTSMEAPATKAEPRTTSEHHSPSSFHRIPSAR